MKTTAPNRRRRWEYARLREEGRLVRVQPPYGAEAWLPTRYEVVRKALSDPRFSRAAALTEKTPRAGPVHAAARHDHCYGPTEHTRLRRVVAQAFTMRRIERMRPRVQELDDGILDTLGNQGPPVDLPAVRAAGLRGRGVRAARGAVRAPDRFTAWIDMIMSSESTPDQVRRAEAEQRSYLADLIALRREQPAEDLLTVLVETRDAGNCGSSWIWSRRRSRRWCGSIRPLSARVCPGWRPRTSSLAG